MIAGNSNVALKQNNTKTANQICAMFISSLLAIGCFSAITLPTEAIAAETNETNTTEDLTSEPETTEELTLFEQELNVPKIKRTQFIDEFDTIHTKCDSQPTYSKVSSGWSIHVGNTNSPDAVFSVKYNDGICPKDSYLDFTANFEKIGTYNGEWIDAKIKFTDPVSGTGFSNGYPRSTVAVNPFWDGQKFFSMSGLRLTYSFFSSKTGEQLDLSGCWITLANFSKGDEIKYIPNSDQGSIVDISEDSCFSESNDGFWKCTQNPESLNLGDSGYEKGVISFKIIDKEPTIQYKDANNTMSQVFYMIPISNSVPKKPEARAEVLN